MSDGTGPGAGLDLGALYAKERERLVRVAARWTRSVADAEDAVQEAFARAVTELPGDHPNPAAWLMVTTKYRAMHASRSAQHAAAAGDAVEWWADVRETAPDTNGGACMGDPATAAVVQEALADLTERQRDVVRQWCLDGADWGDIARELGVSVNAAQHAGYHALTRLRERAARNEDVAAPAESQAGTVAAVEDDDGDSM